MVASEMELVRIAVALGAAGVGGALSNAEQALISAAASQSVPTDSHLAALRSSIAGGGDPLGESFCDLRDAAVRRASGAVYTPESLIGPMLRWALDQTPQRVVDAGCGSGRFLAQVLRQSQDVAAIGIDLDPLATLMTRATVSVLNAGSRVTILNDDYTVLKIPRISGRTAYIGNPPYVRHHQLTPEMKTWAQRAASQLGHKISGLAGLHALFFLATAHNARKGDVGCLVTSSEWLDVNYGAIMRTLILEELGGESLHVIEPTALPFQGTQTTAVISAFRVGERPENVRMQAVGNLSELTNLREGGRNITRQRLAESPRWSGLLHTADKAPAGYVELGEICRVHRGTVTGANAFWVLRHSKGLPQSVLYPSITKARELFAAGRVLESTGGLRLVVDIPTDLDELDAAERRSVRRFIREAERAGVHKGYIASHRRAWWSVGLKQPAPILATYMARRPPAFVRNLADARHINIAHGLYPREDFGEHALSRLADSLRASVTLAQGRVYAGGLTKFEPKEMERFLVPDLAMLRGHDPLPASVDA